MNLKYNSYIKIASLFSAILINFSFCPVYSYSRLFGFPSLNNIKFNDISRDPFLIAQELKENSNKLLVGPLLLDLDRYYVRKPNHLIHVTYKNNNSGFIAINCDKYKINVSNDKNTWKGWKLPRLSFEKDLISKFCKG